MKILNATSMVETVKSPLATHECVAVPLTATAGLIGPVRGDEKRTSIASSSPAVGGLGHATSRGVWYDPLGRLRFVPSVAGPSVSSRQSLSYSDMQLLARSLSSEDRLSVSGSVRALYILLEIYGLRWSSTVQHSFDRTVLVWSACASQSSDWMKFVKYKFAAFFFSHTDQHGRAPISPIRVESGLIDNPRIIASGSAGRFANKLAESKSTKDTFLASLLQCKKGCPRPSKTMVQQSVKKTVEALTTERVPKPNGFLVPWADIPGSSIVDTLLCKSAVIMQLRRTVAELYRGKMYMDRDRYKHIFPSISASVCDSRAQGGAFRSIRKFADSAGMCEETVGGRLPPSRVGFYENARLPEEHIGLNVRTFDVDVIGVEESAKDLYQNLIRHAMYEPPEVKAVGLAESLKVRVITKGAPYTTKVLHPLQKFLWRVLKDHPTFQLVGSEPVSARAVQDRLGAKLGEGEFYLSGDYSDATNELAPWVSECIANAIADEIGLTDMERTLLLRSLTGNIVIDGKLRKAQRWGQLMGSIVSFPVLCIANAALCRWSIEVDKGVKISLARTTLMINGDDVVFRTTQRGHDIWERITAFAGLSSSVGKTFLTRAFAQINSVNFIRLEKPSIAADLSSARPMWFTETKYVNLGLLTGFKRSGEKVGKDAIADSEVTLGTRCRALIKACPDDMRVSVMHKFLKHHEKILTGCGVPWFVPETWGGIGLPSVFRASDIPSDFQPGDAMPEPKWGPSKLDRQIVARMKECPTDKLSGKPLFPVGKPPIEAPWDVHKVVLQRLPVALQFGVPSESDARGWQAIYGALVFDAFLTDIPLMSTKSELGACRVLKRNKRSWQAARLAGKLPPPISLSTLFTSESPQPYLPVSITSMWSSNHAIREAPQPEVHAWSYQCGFVRDAGW